MKRYSKLQLHFPGHIAHFLASCHQREGEEVSLWTYFRALNNLIGIYRYRAG